MSNTRPSIMTSTTSKTFPIPDTTNIKTIIVDTTHSSSISTTINHLAEVMEVKEACVVIPTTSLTQKCRRGEDTCKLRIAASTTPTIVSLQSESAKAT
jgi:hypothetical protein